MNINVFVLNHVLVKRMHEEQQSRGARLRADPKPVLLSAPLFEGIVIKAIALGHDGHLG